MITSTNGGGNGRPAYDELTAPPPRPEPTPGVLPGRRRTPWPLVVVAVLFVVVPFLSWYGTTFLRPLDDEKIEEYLNDTQKPRHVQHALEQIDKKILAGDERARRWYPQVAGLVGNSVPDVRMTAAWVMGDDNNAPEFQSALAVLLNDPEPAVRRMAALSLSRFNDPRSRPELLSMLRPYIFNSPRAGTLLTVLPAGSQVNRESLVARVRGADGVVHEVRSALAGKIEKVSVQPGAILNAGDELLVLAADAENVLQSLRALALVGAAEDLGGVESYAREVEGMPAGVTKQAALTAEAIKGRASRK